MTLIKISKNRDYIFSFLLLIPFIFSISFDLFASEIPEGNKSIILIDNKNIKTKIAEIIFSHEGEKITYEINFEESVFQQEFLSMRPFKCIHREGKMICHFEYLYQKQGYITKDNLVDLEYDLMFLHKTPEEYGINPWNGLYYQLTIENETIKGQLREVDLNVLVAPPKDGDLRPVSANMLHKTKPGSHVFPRLSIE